MKSTKQFLKPVLTAMLLSTIVSCSNKTPETTEVADSSATTTPEPAITAAFTPFKVMMIKHTVADFEKWKVVFVSHEATRKESGQTDLALLRGADNTNQVMIIEKIDDVQKAKDAVGKFKPAACIAGMSRWELDQRRSAWLGRCPCRRRAALSSAFPRDLRRRW